MIVPYYQNPSQIQILPAKALRMHIFAEVFQIFSGGHTPDPLYWKMDTSIDPIPLTASLLDFGAMRLSSKPSLSRSSIPTVLEKSGENQGISFDLESGHPISHYVYYIYIYIIYIYIYIYMCFATSNL